MANIKTICCREIIVTGSTCRCAIINAKGEGISLANADLRLLNLSGMDLRGLDFRGADFTGVDLQFTRLNGCDFRGAKLERTLMKWVQLDGARFMEGDLDGAYKSNMTGHYSVFLREPVGTDV